MHAKKVIVPVDFSHTDDTTLEYAASLAKEKNGQLMVVHVQEVPRAYGGEMYYGIPEPSVDELSDMLRDVKPSDTAIPVQYTLLSGDPAYAIVQFAKDEGADLIVISSHGRTGFLRALMGSVAEAIVRKAHCPVLVCKPGQIAAV